MQGRRIAANCLFGSVMTRQILALLALLSGLAALQAPAAASVLDNLPCDIGVSFDSAQDQGGLPEVVRNERKASRSIRNPALKAPRAFTVPETLRLPVLMGVERALE